MIRILCRITGGLLCAIGILGMLTPIPLGIFFFIAGLMFLIPSTPSSARLVRNVRRKVGIFDRAMSGITNRLPLPYRRILKQTEVDAFDWQ